MTFILYTSKTYTTLFLLLFITLPFYSNAQLDSRLREKASLVVNYVLEGEDHRNPNAIIQAIKIILKEDQIRPMQGVIEHPSIDYQSRDYFDLELLYKKASRMIPEGDTKTRRRLSRLLPKIKKRTRAYQQMAFNSFDGIEIKVYTVEPEGEIPISFPFTEGDMVQLFIEIAKHFSVAVYDKNNELVKIGLQVDKKNGLYALEVLGTGNYKFKIKNLQNDKVSCKIYKHVSQ